MEGEGGGDKERGSKLPRTMSYLVAFAMIIIAFLYISKIGISSQIATLSFRTYYSKQIVVRAVPALNGVNGTGEERRRHTFFYVIAWLRNRVSSKIERESADICGDIDRLLHAISTEVSINGTFAGLSLVRRRILGMATRADCALKRTFVALRDVRIAHARRVRDATAATFLHFSKAGGTWFCSCARKQGCSIPIERYHDGALRPLQSTNCWVRDFRDGPRWVVTRRSKVTMPNGHSAIPPSGGAGAIWWMEKASVRRSDVSCSTRRRKTKQNRWDLTLNENYLPTASPSTRPPPVVTRWATPGPIPFPCDNFTHVTQFRLPMSRLLSHYRHLYTISNVADSVNSGGGKLPSWLPPEARGNLPCTVDEMLEVAPRISNNMMTRQLLGHDGWQLPLGNVNVTHLERAEETLLRYFDAILILEDDDLDAWIRTNLLGWNASLCSEDANARVDPMHWGHTPEAIHALSNATSRLSDPVNESLSSALIAACRIMASAAFSANSNSTSASERMHLAYLAFERVAVQPEQWAKLVSLNAIDRSLYAFAREVSRLDRSAWSTSLIASPSTPDNGASEIATKICGR